MNNILYTPLNTELTQFLLDLYNLFDNTIEYNDDFTLTIKQYKMELDNLDDKFIFNIVYSNIYKIKYYILNLIKERPKYKIFNVDINNDELIITKNKLSKNTIDNKNKRKLDTNNIEINNKKDQNETEYKYVYRYGQGYRRIEKLI